VSDPTDIVAPSPAELVNGRSAARGSEVMRWTLDVEVY